MATILAIAAVLALLFFWPIFGVLIGAFSGWVVGMLAPVWVPSGLALLGVKATADQLVYLGAALGFVGGFFRSHTSVKSKD